MESNPGSQTSRLLGRSGAVALDAEVLELRAFHPGLVAQQVLGEDAWATRRYRILQRRRGQAWSEVGAVPAPLWSRSLGRVPWLSLALRLGVHHLLRLRSGTLLATVNGALLRSTDAGRTFSVAMPFEHFRRPPRHGLMEDSSGRVLLAEYSLNFDRRRPIHVWRSDDDGVHFEPVHRFRAGDVRHVHFLQEDPVDGSLWMGTGDSDSESGIFRSTDAGQHFEEVGRGDQRWRAIAVGFRPEAVYWGTDAGRDAGSYTNRILRWDRRSRRLEEQAELQGPVHGIACTPQGHLFVSTGIEDGPNEADDRVHLWYSGDGARWKEVAAWRRGRQPRRVQYAVAHLLAGDAEIHLTLRGVQGCPLGHVGARVLPMAT